VNSARRETEIWSPASRYSRGDGLGGGVGPVVLVVVVVATIVVVADGGEGGVPSGPELNRCPPRTILTWAGILEIGIWVAQAEITSDEEGSTGLL
jgi:hypothetical protein